MDHRHRSRTALIVFLLCLPLALIAYFAYTFINEKLNVEEIVTVYVSHEGSETITYRDRESIEFYTELFLTSSKLASPLRETEEGSAVTVKLDRGDSMPAYKIYPELSETGCMFTDPRGVYYLIPKESARAMLSREEFAYLYTASVLPDLIVSSGELRTEIAPVEYGWYYKKQDGTYADYNDRPVSEGDENARIYADRANSMTFSRRPDELNVTITTSAGEILTQTDLDSLVFGSDTHLNVRVEAIWLRTGAGNCNGSAVYEFDLLYDIPAIVAVRSGEVEPGGCAEIDVRFLNPDEKVILNSELALGELFFSENEGVMTAVLGVADNNAPGSYTVGYTIGDNTGSFVLEVGGKAQGERTDIYRMSISAELYEKALSGTAQEELQSIMDSVYAEASEKAYSVLGLAKPLVSGKEIQSYGTRVIVNVDDTADTLLFYAIGNTYSAPRGSAVYAAAKGKIVYAGSCGMLGNLIIIDHGCGVMSWYYGLESIERGVGTEVGQSTTLGLTGVNEYDGTETLGYCVTAGKVFVNPTP